MDPVETSTLVQLANALDQLRGSLSLRGLAAAAAKVNRKHHLAVSGQTVSYDHSLRLHTTSCNSCLEAHADRATWLELDLRLAHQGPDARAGLLVRARPPSQPAAIGDIVLELHGQSVGFLGVELCGVDQRGLITRVLAPGSRGSAH